MSNTQLEELLAPLSVQETNSEDNMPNMEEQKASNPEMNSSKMPWAERANKSDVFPAGVPCDNDRKPLRKTTVWPWQNRDCFSEVFELKKEKQAKWPWQERAQNSDIFKGHSEGQSNARSNENPMKAVHYWPWEQRQSSAGNPITPTSSSTHIEQVGVSLDNDVKKSSHLDEPIERNKNSQSLYSRDYGSTNPQTAAGDFNKSRISRRRMFDDSRKCNMQTLLAPDLQKDQSDYRECLQPASQPLRSNSNEGSKKIAANFSKPHPVSAPPTINPN